MIPRDTPHPFLHLAVYAYARAATIRLYPLTIQQCLLPRPAEQDGHASALCVPSLLDKDGRSYSVCNPAFPISLRNISIPVLTRIHPGVLGVPIRVQATSGSSCPGWARNTYPSPTQSPSITPHYPISVARLWLHSWTDLLLCLLFLHVAFCYWFVHLLYMACTVCLSRPVCTSPLCYLIYGLVTEVTSLAWIGVFDLWRLWH